MPKTDITKYIDKAMFEAEPMESNTPKVFLVSATPDPLGSIAAACRMYEGKPTTDIMMEVSDDERRHYWEQVQKTHLKAPLEFVDLHFFIEGVTRAFTHQMVRQRTAVFAQESLRFAVKDNLAAETSYPPSLTADKREARRIWDEQMARTQDSYNWMVADGIPAEDARGLLPHATTTRLNYKTNLRNLIEHAGNRLCTQAQFEWRHVFLGIIAAINKHYSLDGRVIDGNDSGWQWQLIAQSGVFKPVCFQVGHCPFTAVFDRQCTIRERVQKGEFDKIEPSEWAADPTSGRRD